MNKKLKLKNIRKDKGITLIALVLTIIILIILAGVSINLVFNNDGIITKAKDAKENTELAKEEEQVLLNELVDSLENLGGSSTQVEEITASDIEADESYIGKYVNYGGQETFKGVRWRIFNAENGQIQLIADNYIHKDVMPAATNIRRGKAEYSGMQSDFCINSSNSRIALLNYINTTSNWSEFVAVTGATVTGGPTIEQFINSYNRTHGETSEATVKEMFIAKTATMDDGLKGYYVGTRENPETFYISGLSKTEMENLYIIDDTTKAKVYWLGSPSANTTSRIVIVACDSGSMSCSAHESNIIGLRPLVLLPSGTTLIKQENGTYNI